jgi:ribosomal protein S12 methylthiotransferase
MRRDIADKQKIRPPARPRSVAAISLGCPKNRVDTEVMLGALATAGYAICSDPSDADVIVVNTCGFIADAAAESRAAISEAAKIKRSGKKFSLVVAGCLAEREKANLREEFPEIDIIAGTSSYIQLAGLLDKNEGDSFAPQSFLHDHTHPRLVSTPPWTAYLKIAEGCSNRCSYCMIPGLRGKYRGRRPESLLIEASDLAKLGVRELILVAQDTTRFGTGLGLKSALPDLLRGLARIDGIHWIRLMYAYPARITKSLARAIAETPEVCRYIDMPIQHIDENILMAMNRRGGERAIRRAIDTLRTAIPDICIRTTVLVGFPGETRTQFRRLLKFVEETEFDKLGAFVFSPESGTAAAAMPRQISTKEKQSRLSEIMELQRGISLRKNRGMAGETIETLVEETGVTLAGSIPAKMKKMKYNSGRSRREAPEIDGEIFFSGPARAGSFVQVRIENAGEYELFGTITG